jgi:hypothetical protein
LFDKFRRNSAAARLLEEQLYEQVVNELSNGQRRNGLWAKALANSDGAEEKAKALYIKYRVQSIKDEFEVTEAIKEQDEILNKQKTEEENWKKNEEDRLKEEERQKKILNEINDEIRKQKWERDIKRAAKYLARPIPSDVFCEKYNITKEKLNSLVGSGMIKGYAYDGELYVQDNDPNT